MLEHVALGQSRFMMPGVAPDPRGVLLGRYGLLVFASLEGVVSWLRVYGAEAPLDELLAELAIQHVKTPLKSRGLQMTKGKKPALNWHVTPDELRSYEASVDKFFAEFADDIIERKVLPTASWEFRNAAHHSGTATSFVAAPGDTSKEFFGVTGLPSAYVCDGSLLRAAGIANSGLTLVALTYRLAEVMRANA